MANSPRQAERETTQGTYETARKATEQVAQSSRAMSDAMEQAARAGGEAFRRNAEAVSSNWRNSGEAATRIAEQSMDQLSKIFGLSGESARETAQQSASNVQALVDSSTVIAGSLQSVSEEWMRFMQSRIEQNLHHFDEYLGCRTPQECMELQTRMVRDNIEALLHSARRASELSTKLADDAVKRMGGSTLVPR